MKEAVCDSSTLILLARSGLLRFMYAYVNKILIPNAVYGEVVAEGKKRGKVDSLIVEQEIGKGKIAVVEVPESDFETISSNFHMDKGEAEAVALCIKKKALFLGVDDREAIKACRVFQVPFITALAFLVKLCTDKKISKEEAEIAFSMLEKIGFYSEEIMEAAKKESGLKWKKL